MKKINDSGLLLFIREIATNPSAMGAACPSSKYLAQRIAQLIPNDKGLVLELGGGTGVITHALLKNGLPPENLIVVERSESLAQHLQERFPQLKIIHGDAQHLTQLLAQEHTISAVVSGLPFRTLPTDTVKIIGTQLENILKDGAVYIQFTYSLHRSPLPPSPRLKYVNKQFIWRNFPPARIDIFRYD